MTLRLLLPPPHRVYAWDVDPAPLDDVDEVVDLVVLRAQDVGIVDAVLGTYRLGGLQVDLGAGRGGGEADAALVLAPGGGGGGQVKCGGEADAPLVLAPRGQGWSSEGERVDATLVLAPRGQGWSRLSTGRDGRGGRSKHCLLHHCPSALLQYCCSGLTRSAPPLAY